MFSKGLFPWGVKRCYCVGMGSTHKNIVISKLFLLGLSTTQAQLLITLGKTPSAKIVGKGENAGNQHFLLFPCFQPYQKNHHFMYFNFVVCKSKPECNTILSACLYKVKALRIVLYSPIEML